MKDPYKILGVDRTATDDEIKRAYRELARKYHPDNYAKSPFADLAEEKMKEINDAYDRIQDMRGSGGSRSGYTESESYDDRGNTYSSSSSDNGSGGYRFDPNRGSGRFADIRQLIGRGSFSEADIKLNSVAKQDRDAEWNFLKGCIFVRRGWYFEAEKHFNIAIKMDPDNREYTDALAALRAQSNARADTSYSGNRGCSGCDVCSGLICADCLCECCGGDLISCC